MRLIQSSELLDLAGYEQIREHFLRRIIELKRVRRIALGEHMTLLFENRDTALFQIQEMLRTERITRENAIEHELETYNQLVPAANELSATVFIEYPDREERERMLAALAGVERNFYVIVGSEQTRAESDKRGDRTDRTTAVHYVKFKLGEAATSALQGPNARVLVGVDHPAYCAEVALPAETVASLCSDFD